jgi:hypothetical protein
MGIVWPWILSAQPVEGQRDVAGPGVADRLAVVERLERGEFVDLGLDQVGELQHQPAPLAGVHPRPRPLVEGFAGRPHGGVHVGGVPLGDLRDHLLGGRIDRGEGLAAPGRRPLPVDEQLGLPDLRRGRAARSRGCGHASGPRFEKIEIPRRRPREKLSSGSYLR